MHKTTPYSLILGAVLNIISLHYVHAQTSSQVRGLVSLDRPIVKLKDLFSAAGREANSILGPAPLPGTRIVVGEPQLASIAKRYGVDWIPTGDDPSVIIERPGVPIARDQIRQMLRPALRRAGAPPHIALRISYPTLPMIPPNAHPEILVNRLVYDRIDGNFQAAVLITAPSMNAVSVTISGLATPAVRAVVAVHNLLPGEILRSTDFKPAWVPSGTLPSGAINRPSLALGMQVNRAITRGSVLDNQNVASPVLIDRGAIVSLAVDMPGLKVTARGIALAAGGMGSVIPVINPSSREVVQAIIDGSNHAHVVSGSMPTRSRRAIPYYNMNGVQP